MTWFGNFRRLSCGSPFLLPHQYLCFPKRLSALVRGIRNSKALALGIEVGVKRRGGIEGLLALAYERRGGLFPYVSGLTY